MVQACSKLNNMNKPTTISLMAVALTGGLLITGCSSSPEELKENMNDKMENVQKQINELPSEPTVADWESERNDVLQELRDLRETIDRRLSSSNEKLAGKNLKPSERTDEMAVQAELIREKDRVEVAIANVESAETGTWISIKEDTRKTTNEVKDWWSRLKENVDKKTDADKDNDGH